MKKVLALVMATLLALTFVFTLASCSVTIGEETDYDYIKNKGKLVVGITEFEPMDYKDENGNWIGFDADAATLFAEYLGVEVEFIVIDWDNKVLELNSKAIDVVWNGMTLTDEIASAMEPSNTYFNNAQVVIVNADVASQYQTAEACKSLQFAVESGSAGQAAAEANGYNITPVVDQASAVNEVKAGTCDAAVIDFLMAIATVGEGTDYDTLTYTVSLSTEEYTVGFRKGSDMAAKLNTFFTEKASELKQIAEKYGIEEYLLVK